MEVVIVPVDVDTPPYVETLDGDTLKALQGAVGGYIEALPYPEAGLRSKATVYVNEEGKFTEDRNPQATAFMAPALFDGDWISGPLVITGFNPATGDTLDVPEGVLDRFGIKR